MVTLTTEADGTKTLLFNQGETSTFHIDILEGDPAAAAELGGYEARGMGRAKVGSMALSPVVFAIVCTISGSRLTCTILPSASSAATVYTGVYDIEIFASADPELVYRVQQGKWTMSQEVTISG